MQLSAQSWQYGDRMKPEAGTMSYSYSAHYHRHHCTLLQVFEQFGALYVHNLDDKYGTRSTVFLVVKILFILPVIYTLPVQLSMNDVIV